MGQDTHTNESISHLDAGKIKIDINDSEMNRQTKTYYVVVPPNMLQRSLQVLAENNISVMVQELKLSFASREDAYKGAQRIHLYGVHILESNMDLAQA
jgi:hypothetical protein